MRRLGQGKLEVVRLDGRSEGVGRDLQIAAPLQMGEPEQMRLEQGVLFRLGGGQEREDLPNGSGALKQDAAGWPRPAPPGKRRKPSIEASTTAWVGVVLGRAEAPAPPFGSAPAHPSHQAALDPEQPLSRVG